MPQPERKRKLLLVLGSLAGGGAERQALAWFRHFDRNQFELYLYLITPDGSLRPDLPDDVQLHSFAESSHANSLNWPGRRHRQQARHLAEWIDHIQPDHIISVGLLMTLLVERVPTTLPQWLAVEMADPRFDFDDQIQRFKWLKRRLLHRAYHRATPVAVSEGVRTGLVEFYHLPHDRIELIPNTIDLDRIHTALATETSLPIDPNHDNVLAVGRLQPQKGYDTLLAALRLLVHERHRERCHLHILGTGPLHDELTTYIQQNALTQHVSFHGFQTNPYAWMAACDAYCLASHYEGLPLALLEAMACGIPVIATDCPSGPKEVLQDGQFGHLVSTGNPSALATAIEHVLDHPANAHHRATTAQTHVQQQYAIPSAIHAWNKLLTVPESPQSLKAI